MSRIRTVKPEFWVSEQVGDCSPNARLTFIGMWNFCDDRGVHPAKTKTLRAEVWGLDQGVTAAQVGDWIDELIRAGLVREFSSGGDQYWFVTGWKKHQRIEKPNNKYPEPPAGVAPSDSPQVGGAPKPDAAAVDAQVVVDQSTNGRRVVAEESSIDRTLFGPGLEGIGVEGKGLESTGSLAAATPGQAAAVATPPPAPGAAPAAAGASADTAGEGSTRRKRLGKDWALPQRWGDWTLAEYPHWTADTVRKIAAQFRDHWVGNAEVKSDWEATWRNWCRSKITQREHPAPRGTAARESREQRLAAGRAALAALEARRPAKALISDPNTIDMPPPAAPALEGSDA